MSHSHNHFVKEFSRALDDIEMAICHRIEAAWINRTSHLRRWPRNSEMKSDWLSGLLADALRALPNFAGARQCNQSMADPPPYKRIAVATTFSPRFRDVLAEANRI